MNLISDIVKEALVQQISSEKANASLYLYIANFLHGKGLSNLGKMFEGQHDEEQSHSLRIYKLLTDLGVVFEMLPIEGSNMQFNSILDIANLFLEREIQTTNSLKEIRNLAAEQGEGGCPIAEVEMIEMLKLQQHELEEATTFLDKAILTDGDWKFVLLWDMAMEG